MSLHIDSILQIVLFMTIILSKNIKSDIGQHSQRSEYFSTVPLQEATLLEGRKSEGLSEILYKLLLLILVSFVVT